MHKCHNDIFKTIKPFSTFVEISLIQYEQWRQEKKESGKFTMKKTGIEKKIDSGYFRTCHSYLLLFGFHNYLEIATIRRV